MTYHFHPGAEAEHLENIAYYEDRRAGLGARYLAEFESVLEQVCENPHRYRIERVPDIRRVRMRRFPFTLFCIGRHKGELKYSPWLIAVDAQRIGLRGSNKPMDCDRETR